MLFLMAPTGNPPTVRTLHDGRVNYGMLMPWDTTQQRNAIRLNTTRMNLTNVTVRKPGCHRSTGSDSHEQHDKPVTGSGAAAPSGAAATRGERGAGGGAGKGCWARGGLQARGAGAAGHWEARGAGKACTARRPAGLYTVISSRASTQD